MNLALYDLGSFRGHIGKFRLSLRPLPLRKIGRDAVETARAGTLGKPFRIPDLEVMKTAIQILPYGALIAESSHLPAEITPPDKDFISTCSYVIFPPRIESVVSENHRPKFVSVPGFVLRNSFASEEEIGELCRAGQLSPWQLESTMFVNIYHPFSSLASNEEIRQTMLAMLNLLRKAS